MRLRHLTLTSALACAALAVPAAASAAPAVTATGPATAERGVDYTLDLAGSGFTKVACGLGYDVDWDSNGTFDETVSSFYPHATKQFGALGARTITVRAQTGGGSWGGCDPAESATTTKTITVVNAKPHAEITCLDGAAEIGAQVFCETDVAADPDGTIASLRWDVDGDGFDDGTGSELTTSFATAGDKTVRLQATDDDGAATIATTVVEVYALGVGPAFAVSSEQIELGDPVTFTAPAGEDEGDREYERSWDADGDGTWDDWSSDRRLTWLYEQPGTYTVRLRVEQVGGDPRDATLATRTVTVTEPAAEELPPSHPAPPAAQPAAPAPAPRAATFTGTAGAKAPAASSATSTAKAAPKPTRAAAKKKRCKAVKAKKGKRARKACKTAKKRARR